MLIEEELLSAFSTFVTRPAFQLCRRLTVEALNRSTINRCSSEHYHRCFYSFVEQCQHLTKKTEAEKRSGNRVLSENVNCNKNMYLSRVNALVCRSYISYQEIYKYSELDPPSLVPESRSFSFEKNSVNTAVSSCSLFLAYARNNLSSKLVCHVKQRQKLDILMWDCESLFIEAWLCKCLTDGERQALQDLCNRTRIGKWNAAEIMTPTTHIRLRIPVDGASN